MFVNAQISGIAARYTASLRPAAEQAPKIANTPCDGMSLSGNESSFATAGAALRNLAFAAPVATPMVEIAVPAQTPASLPDARPAGPREGTAAERRLFGIPEALDTNLGGPPALPSHGITKADIDPATGAPFLGEFPGSHADSKGHNYSLRNALPAGLTQAQATEAFDRFNAPTHDALIGIGNDMSLHDASIDPSVMAPAFLRGHLFGSKLGGEVKLTHGTTPEGMPWAINSTKLLHPFVGHVTRTLEEYNNRFYIRTDGLSQGSDDTDGLRNRVNCASGPTSFGRLDGLASTYASQHFLDAPAPTPPPKTDAQQVSGAFFAGPRAEMHRLAQQLGL